MRLRHQNEPPRTRGEGRDHDQLHGSRSHEPRSWQGEDQGPDYGRTFGQNAPYQPQPGRYGYGRGDTIPRDWAGDRDVDWRERQSWYATPVGERHDPDYRQPTGQGGMMNAGQAEQGSPMFYGQSGWNPGEGSPGQGYGFRRHQPGADDWANRSHAPGARIWSEPEPGRGGSHQQEFEPDYLHWRETQMRNLDRDYFAWREERRQKFSQDFDDWRNRRVTARAGEETPQPENLNVGDVADGGVGDGDDSKKR